MAISSIGFNSVIIRLFASVTNAAMDFRLWMVLIVESVLMTLLAIDLSSISGSSATVSEGTQSTNTSVFTISALSAAFSLLGNHEHSCMRRRQVRNEKMMLVTHINTCL